MPYKIWRRLIFTQQKIRKYYSVVLVTKKGYENYVISALIQARKCKFISQTFSKAQFASGNFAIRKFYPVVFYYRNVTRTFDMFKDGNRMQNCIKIAKGAS